MLFSRSASFCLLCLCVCTKISLASNGESATSPFALTRVALTLDEIITKPPFASGLRPSGFTRKRKTDADSPTVEHSDNKTEKKPRKDCLSCKVPTTECAQLKELLGGMHLLANNLNAVVVDYLVERVFCTEPQLVLQFNFGVKYAFVGDGTLLLVGLNTDGKRVVLACNLLDIKAEMLSQIGKDANLLAFDAYPDHGAYIYVEQDRILLESIDDSKVLLSIPRPTADRDWNVTVAPSASKSGLVYMFFLRKMVLIDIRRKKYVVKEIKREYGDIVGVSLNEAETLLACSTMDDGIKLFKVQCHTDGGIDLVECSSLPSRVFFHPVTFLKENILAAGQWGRPHTFYRVDGKGGAIEQLEGKGFDSQELENFTYHPVDDIFVAFAVNGRECGRESLQSKTFFKDTKVLVISPVRDVSAHLSDYKVSPSSTYVFIQSNSEKCSYIYRISTKRLQKQ